MSFLRVTWWSRLGWKQIDTWQHPQTTSSCCRRQLTYCCGHVPQESRTRAGGSLSENWPKRPRLANKTSHWRQMRLLIIELWSFWVNEVHMRNSMEGTCWSEFEGLSVEDWTCAATLSWSSYCCKQGWITIVYPVKWQRISRLHISPSTLPGGPHYNKSWN